MKLNFQTISLGALATLSLLAAPMVMTHSAHAQGDGRRGQHLEQLNLSEDQASQIEAIHNDARSQMESVLTDEQQAQLESSEDRGRRAWRQLNLSDSQREELQGIREASREEVNAVLTDEQQAQLEDMRAERGARRGGTRPGSER
ncbi:MAG: Spy/CpxP family protein refolding chaperone [Phormidesmis sp.]